MAKRYRAIVERTREYSVLVYAEDKEEATQAIKDGDAYYERFEGGPIHEKLVMGPFRELTTWDEVEDESD